MPAWQGRHGSGGWVGGPWTSAPGPPSWTEEEGAQRVSFTGSQTPRTKSSAGPPSASPSFIQQTRTRACGHAGAHTTHARTRSFIVKTHVQTATPHTNVLLRTSRPPSADRRREAHRPRVRLLFRARPRSRPRAGGKGGLAPNGLLYFRRRPGLCEDLDSSSYPVMTLRVVYYCHRWRSSQR